MDSRIAGDEFYVPIEPTMDNIMARTRLPLRERIKAKSGNNADAFRVCIAPDHLTPCEALRRAHELLALQDEIDRRAMLAKRARRLSEAEG